jgi:hypothetical protein
MKMNFSKENILTCELPIRYYAPRKWQLSHSNVDDLEVRHQCEETISISNLQDGVTLPPKPPNILPHTNLHTQGVVGSFLSLSLAQRSAHLQV